MIRRIVRIVFFLFIVFAVATLSCKFFGYDYYVVVSDSMYPAIPKYSLVYIDTNPQTIDVGDVIAFNGTTMPIMHRVVDIDGDIYKTHGDNNSANSFEYVSINEIIGVSKLHIPIIGVLFLDIYIWFITALIVIVYLIVMKLIKEVKKK